MKTSIQNVTLFAVATALILAGAHMALADTLTVTSTDGYGPGTLRDAVGAARDGDTIVFDSSLNGQTITLWTKCTNYQGSDELYINKNLTITGPGAANLAISAGGGTRVFEVASGVQVAVSGLTIENGDSRYGGFDPDLYDGYGGNILNFGEMTLTDCVVSDSYLFVGTWGGGIANFGSMTVTGCTVAGNPGSNAGGGIYNAGLLTLDSSLVTDNGTDWEGGGIFNDSGAHLQVLGSIVCDNTAPYAADLYNAKGAHFYEEGSMICDTNVNQGKLKK